MNKHLVRALLDNPKDQWLYQSNAEFRATVDALAQLLPAWIDGIADKCEREGAKREADIERLVRTPFKLT